MQFQNSGHTVPYCHSC